MHWVFASALGLSLVAVSGGLPCCGAQACGGLVSEHGLAVAHGPIRCGSWTLERRLSSCGTQASVWTLPGPGIEPVSPASAGGSLFPVPPGTAESLSLDVTSLFHSSRARRLKRLRAFFLFLNQEGRQAFLFLDGSSQLWLNTEVITHPEGSKPQALAWSLLSVTGAVGAGDGR